MLPPLWLSAADAVTLAWDASARAVGYRLHYGERSRAYNTTLEIGAPTQAAVGGLTPGHTYFFAITAYNAAGESEYSDEVSSVIPESPPPPPVDTTPPSAAITSSADGATVPRKGTVTVAVSASDDVGVTQVPAGEWATTPCRWPGAVSLHLERPRAARPDLSAASGGV